MMRVCGVQLASKAEPIAKDVTHGVIRPGAKQVAQTAERLGDDEHRQRVQVATQKLASQVCPSVTSFKLSFASNICTYVSTYVVVLADSLALHNFFKERKQLLGRFLTGYGQLTPV